MHAKACDDNDASLPQHINCEKMIKKAKSIETQSPLIQIRMTHLIQNINYHRK
jgi:hypothetical protein